MAPIFGSVPKFIAFSVPAFVGEVHVGIVAKLREAGLSSIDVQKVTRANLGQDAGANAMHPEFHFDDVANFAGFGAGFTYINSQYRLCQQPAVSRDDKLAALGRMTHAIQDLYAHSNYVELYAEFAGKPLAKIAPETIPTLTDALRDMPGFAALLKQRLHTGTWRPDPRDPLNSGPMSHSANNKDDPSRPGFAQARNLAERHTMRLYGLISDQL